MTVPVRGSDKPATPPWNEVNIERSLAVVVAMGVIEPFGGSLAESVTTVFKFSSVIDGIRLGKLLDSFGCTITSRDLELFGVNSL